MDALHSTKPLSSQPVHTSKDLSLKQDTDIANKTVFLSQLADNEGSLGAQVAKDILIKDPMFMAGTGISSLGYTFLLLQMFSNLEISLLKSGLEQAKISNEMYKQLKKLDFEAANDIWLSGVAKGISQITGAIAQFVTYGISSRAQNNVLKKNTATITGTPNTKPQVDQAANVAGTIPSAAPAAPAAAQPAPAAAQPAATSTEGLAAQPATNALSTSHAPQGNTVSKEQQQKINSIAEQGVMFGRALHDIAIGAGSVGGGWHDAEAKKQEGLKHLIQMVIENTNTSKQRAQQQYEEAAKQIEAAIQAYNAAANASH